MIIVEGMDGTGKSGLVKKLSEDVGFPIAPRVVGADTVPLVDIREWTDKNIDAGYQDVIFDRHRLFSDRIYGPYFGRGDQIFYDRSWLNQHLKTLYTKIKPVIIFCDIPHEENYKNIMANEKNSLFRDEHLFNELRYDYDEIVLEAIMLNLGSTLVYDYTTDEVTDYSLGVPMFGRLAGYQDIVRFIRTKNMALDETIY